jgi:hypothetical protein
MSEINKSEETVTSEAPVETPLTAPDESFSEVGQGAEAPESIEQDLASDGALPDQQPETDNDAGEALNGEAPEGSQPDVDEDRSEVPTDAASEDVSNTTEESGSFWSGFFGSPNIPNIK